MIDNLQKLRENLQSIGVDGVLVSMSNSFSNQESEMSDVCFISGFSGSNGKAIISKDKAILNVDGRYTTQAVRQTDSNFWQINMYPEFDTNKIISMVLKKGEVLAVCPFSVSYKTLVSIRNTGVNVKVVDMHPITKERALGKSSNTLCIMNENNMGELISNRIRRIQETIKEGESIVVEDKALIGWIFGIRKSIISNDKGVLANIVAYIPKAGKPSLFCDLETEGAHIEFDVYKIEEFEEKSKDFDSAVIGVNYSNILAYFVLALQKNGFAVNQLEKKYGTFESIKNKTEIENQKKGAELTSLAFIKTLSWVEKKVKDGIYTSEKNVIAYFKDSLGNSNGIVGLSFNPISAFGHNTSVVHYSPNSESDAVINSEGLFLFDAGFHFENATTDMTRTVYIGESPSDELIRLYSIILKSVILFSKTRFPDKVSAASLDSIARYNIWKEGIDYNFGTGHGIGAFGNVHEHPRISQSSNDKITDGMIITVEPGIYRESFGIRLENMLLTVKDSKTGFVNFETLNYIPFCRKLINKELFDNSEISWINDYHKSVYEKFKDILEDDYDSMSWLLENTKDI